MRSRPILTIMAFALLALLFRLFYSEELDQGHLHSPPQEIHGK